MPTESFTDRAEKIVAENPEVEPVTDAGIGRDDVRETERRSAEDAEYERLERELLGHVQEPDADTPQAEAAPAPEGEWTPPTREDWERIRARSELVDGFDQRLAADPAQEIAAWLSHLTPEQQRVAIAQAGLTTPGEPEADPYQNWDEDAMSPVEQFVNEHRDEIRHGGRFMRELGEHHSQQVQVNTELLYQLAISTVRQQAILDALGFEMPAPDPQEVMRLMNQGKDVVSAATEHYNPRVSEAAKKYRANGRPLPETVGSRGSASANKTNTKGMDFAHRASVVMRELGLS